MGKSGKRRPPPPESLWAQHDRRVQKAIASRFRASLMSNAKWVKVFQLLSAPGLDVSGYRWKFVESERVFLTGLVRENDLDERGLRDGRFQPMAFREIEWIEALTEHSDEAMASLERQGEFPAERTPSGVLIRGYS